MNQSIRTDLYTDLFLFKVNVEERRILSLGFSFLVLVHPIPIILN